MELNEVLSNENGRQMFMDFLKTEYSQENLEFWIQCQSFKKIKHKKQLKKYSEQIYTKYICQNGSNSVNIDHEARKIIQDNLRKPFPDMFNVAEEQIFNLMQTDSYSRFIKSKFYKNFLSTVGKEMITPRKRKLIESGQPVECHTYENDSVAKNPKFFKESDIKLQATFELNKDLRKIPYDVNFNSREQIQNDLYNCDNESLYCNAPIYSSKLSIEENSSQSNSYHSNDKRWFNNRFIRIILPDCSEEFVSITQNLPIRLVIENLFMKKNLKYSSYKLFSIQTNETIDLDKDISSLILTDVRIEQTINFSIHFPEGYVIQIETSPHKLAFYTLKKILTHFGINLVDIELYDDQGHLLCENTLMKPMLNLDFTNLYVNYLSSLRTYINLTDIYDLNEDGICVKSIKFQKYNRPKLVKQKNDNVSKLNVTTVNFEANLKENSFKFIDESHDNHFYSNIDDDGMKNIDLADLSFSNENKTEDFLNDIMITDVSKLKYICTPTKQSHIQPKQQNNQSLFQNQQNVYENLNPVHRTNINEEKLNNKTPMHKARLVFIDDNNYENNDIIVQHEYSMVQSPNQCSLSTKLFMEHISKERCCKCRCDENVSKRNNTNFNNFQFVDHQNVNPMKPSNVLKPIEQNLVNSPVGIRSESPFTKYLLQSSRKEFLNTSTFPSKAKSNSIHNKVNNATRLNYTAQDKFCSPITTPLNRPDLIQSTKMNKIRTLSRFHKIV